MVSEDDQFQVLEEWNGLDPSGRGTLFIRIEELYTVDDVEFAAVSNDASSLEIDLAVSQIKTAVEEETIIPKERSSSMHQ